MAKLVHKEQNYTGGGDTSDLIKWSEATTSVKKNLLKNKAVSQTINGVTFTVNSDGSIKAVGTFATQDPFLISNGWNDYDVSWIKPYEGKSVIISGGITNVSIGVRFYDANGTQIGDLNSITASTGTIPSNIVRYDAFLYPTSSSIAVDDTFYPMLRLASIADDTYEPYIPDNTELMRYTDNAVLGAKNLLPNNATSKTINGVTFTVNSDGSITVNGTATATAFFYFLGDAFNNSGLTLNGTYKISSKNYISNASYLRVGITNGAYENITEEKEVTFNNNDIYAVIRINSGEVVSNVTLYPMIRLATDTDDTFVPYAMTNRELTDELTVQTASITTPIQTQEWNLHYVKKYGKVVEAVVTMKLGENVSAWGTIAQIPTGFRPSGNQYPQVVGIKGDYTSFINLQITPSGNVQTAGALTSGTIIRFDATYIIN